MAQRGECAGTCTTLGSRAARPTAHAETLDSAGRWGASNRRTMQRQRQPAHERAPENQLELNAGRLRRPYNVLISSS
eukprot:8593959-Pyramimonas_sp.AAC.1